MSGGVERDYVNAHFRAHYPSDHATAWESDWCSGGVFRRYTGSEAQSNIFPPMHLADGTVLSVQGHFGAYSWPRDDFADEGYSQVEILGPDLPELDAYRDGMVGDKWLYGYVPVQTVNALIDRYATLAQSAVQS